MMPSGGSIYLIQRLLRQLKDPFGIIFVFGWTAFGWPVISAAASWGIKPFFGYLFWAWSLLILLMLIVARVAAGEDQP